MCKSTWWSGQGLLHEQVSVAFDKKEALCILMQYEIELMYEMIKMRQSGTGHHILITENHMIAWNKHSRYKEGWLYFAFWR